MKKVVNVDYGVSSVYSGGIIEINRKIKGKLRKKILKHEKRHTLGKYSKKDLNNDFHAKKSHFFEAFSLSLRNIEMLIGYFPIMYSYYFKKFTWNDAGLFPFVYFGAIFILFFSILFGVKFILSLLCWICFYTIINLLLLIYTHIYVRKRRRV